MSTHDESQHPRGDSGRWAEKRRAAPGPAAALTAPPPVDRERFPSAPLSDGDRAVLADHRGALADGYDPEKIDRLFMNLDSAHLVCVWNVYDEYGYGGDSDFAGCVMGSRASGDLGVGRAVPARRGAWRRMHPDVWRHLSDPDVDVDLASVPSLLDDEEFDFAPGVDPYDLPGNGFRNVALEDETIERCSEPECGERLDDGEGWDGLCGTHADLAEQHREGEHAPPPGGGGRRDDCPDC